MIEKAFNIGAIYKINMDENDDVTPKDGLSFRPKYLIIIGTAEDGFYVAYVLVNKGINTNFITTKTLLDCQFPIYRKDYPSVFKEEISYANLGKIREMEKSRLLTDAEYQCDLTEADLEMVLDSLRKSKVITQREKIRYKLIE